MCLRGKKTRGWGSLEGKEEGCFVLGMFCLVGFGLVGFDGSLAGSVVFMVLLSFCSSLYDMKLPGVILCVSLSRCFEAKERYKSTTILQWWLLYVCKQS